jgi:DNA-directed RNA polymerase specialized sigma24 family protein
LSSDKSNNEGDAELIRQAQETWSKYDEKFALLWLFHQRYIENLCSRILNSTDVGQDAAQDIYLRARLHFGTLKAGKAFKAWLITSAERYCFNYLKMKKNQPAASFDDETANLHNWIAETAQDIENVISADQWREIQQLAKAGLEEKDYKLFCLITAEREGTKRTASIIELSDQSGIAYTTVQYRLKCLRRWFDTIQKEVLNK